MNKILIIAGVIAGALLIIFLLWWQLGPNIIGIDNGQKANPPASLTGLPCENYSKRPIAVMMASDPIARPLSGISQADIVIEMPVTPNGMTRMMAIFQCQEPAAEGEPRQGREEIGSIRSAREDFIPIAKSFGAIYAHWGGEREALKKLDGGILDNIDAMKYEGTVFYRKDSAPRPHNGFTNIELLMDKAGDLGYGLDDLFRGYLRTIEKQERNLSNIVETISISYKSPYDVKWTYNYDTNKYKRIRGGEVEIDANTGSQVEADNIVIIRTKSKVLSIDYISVDTLSGGETEFYQNGIKASGTWENNDGGLRFHDTNGIEMKFIPGKMWIEITTENL